MVNNSTNINKTTSTWMLSTNINKTILNLEKVNSTNINTTNTNLSAKESLSSEGQQFYQYQQNKQ